MFLIFFQFLLTTDSVLISECQLLHALSRNKELQKIFMGVKLGRHIRKFILFFMKMYLNARNMLCILPKANISLYKLHKSGVRFMQLINFRKKLLPALLNSPRMTVRQTTTLLDIMISNDFGIKLSLQDILYCRFHVC